MKIRFVEGSGLNSVAAAQNFIKDMDTRASNLTPYFRGLEDDIIKQVKSEFDPSNPNRWPDTTTAWQGMKRSMGYPENIGVFTGKLLEAASDDAIKTYAPTFMKWEIREVYSLGFTIRRPVGITTIQWVRSLGRRIASVIVGRNTTTL